MARTVEVDAGTPPTSGTDDIVVIPDEDGVATDGGRLPHLPALDGLRGLAVAVVVLFHGGFSWMTGGYLGVSTFFTLSGFLITALLLAERRSSGSVDLRAFWTRRFRRLMPAALAALGLAIAFGMTAADAVQRRNLAGDVGASLIDLANWRFILSGQVYADLFGAPSPVLHFWSLAIEEQFYLLYPLLVWVAFRVLRLSIRVFAGVLAGLIAISLAVTLFAGFSPDRIYLGTDTRSAEVLVGALLATIVHHRRVAGRLATGRRTTPVVAGLGAVALAVCAVLWISVPQETGWLYRGGLTAYAGLTALVLLAATAPSGPVRALLSAAPLRALGTISYGVYLYHWPVFLWLSPERTGWSDGALLLPRLAVTFALALVSFHLLETPVRRGGRLVGVRPIRLVPLVAGALVVAAVVVTLEAPRPVIDLDAAAAQLETMSSVPLVTGGDATGVGGADHGDAGATAPGPVPPPAPVTVTGTPPKARVAVFGDSTAMMTAIGLYGWAGTTHEIDMVPGGAWLGCGIGRGGERRSGNEYGVVPERCNQWAATWADRVATGQPNVAVVQIGPWDVADRRLPGDPEWRALGDPVYDDFLLREMTDAVDTLSAQGAQVLWLSAPPVGAGTLGDAMEIRGVAADPARTTRLNELIATLPDQRPGKVRVVDLAGWLASSGEDIRLRPDGVHFGEAQAIEVAGRWLGPALVEAYQDAWHVAETERLAQADASVRRVLVLGDPSAAGVADALATWGASSGLIEVVTIGQPACGVLQTSRRAAPAGIEATPAECEQVQYGWMQSAVAAHPDIIVVTPSIWDLTDVAFADGPVLAPTEDAYRDEATRELRELGHALTRAAPSVIWLAPPAMAWAPTAGAPGAAAAIGPAIGEQRAAAYVEVLHDAVGTTPGSTVVDLAALLDAAPPLAADPAATVDGFAVAAGDRAPLGDRLGPAILAGP